MKIIVKKEHDNQLNKDVVELLNTYSTEIMAAFSNPPEFGSISVKITYHQGYPVKLESGRCVSCKLEKGDSNQYVT